MAKKEKMIRLGQAARELNVGISTIVETLAEKGYEVENKANSKIPLSQLVMLADAFGVSIPERHTNAGLNKANKESKETTATNVAVQEAPASKKSSNNSDQNNETQSKENSPKEKSTTEAESEKPSTPSTKTEEKIKPNSEKLPGLKVIDKIDLEKQPKNNESSPKKRESTQNKSKPDNQPKNITKTKEEKLDKPVKKDQKPSSENTNNPKKTTPPRNDKTETPIQEKRGKSNNDPNETVKKSVEKPTDKKPNEGSTSETKDRKQKNPREIETKTKVKSKAQGARDKKPRQEPKPTAKSSSTAEPKNRPAPENEETDTSSDEKKKETEVIKAKAKTLKGLTILDKIELPSDRKKKGNRPVASSDDKNKKKRKRKKKRIKREEGTGRDNQNAQNQNQNQNQNNTGQNQDQKNKSSEQGSNRNNNNNNNSNNNRQGNNNRNNNNRQGNNNRNNNNRQGNNNRNNNNRRNRSRNNNNNNNDKKKTTEISEAEIQNQIKATLAKLSNKGKSGRRPSRSNRNKDRDNKNLQEQEGTKKLKVTEFISANDLASLMNVSVTQVISTCMSLGMFVSINQRLDAEAITFIADEFGYEAEFINVEEDDKFLEEESDTTDNLEPRAPIVTIMGHVDHGKTSLLDYIRNANVTASESGGITQHIGAYDVMVEDGRRIAFLDTPGHEAFTAMRARGAKVTDIVILVVAADDSVMPQTKEAINHARVADVPIVIAINKVDKESANADKIREELSKENVLVESWGGKYQDQEISAKTGQGIDELLEKVLLEAELLELKANSERSALGTVIEASLDKGKGYVATVLVQNGTMKVGDVMLAGSHYGKVKAMNDHRGKRVKEAIPSTPVQVLGLDGAPQAGDVLRVMDSEREAREIATKRGQILREQNFRATKGLTLEEIGRRRALGDFQELKIIVKGDVDGSVEALSDSLLELSTEEIEVKIIHKAVGQISEADIMLASASEAIIVGFQVRPSANARKAAEGEKVQIKLYSVIYNAIEEVKDAMEGMLAPKVEEVIVGNMEIRETFKISKVGTVAGCYVTDGYIKKQNRIRLIRDGIVTYEGEIDQLKRFKDDVLEVKSGFECGMNIKSFNDIKVGDVIESYEQREIKRKL